MVPDCGNAVIGQEWPKIKGGHRFRKAVSSRHWSVDSPRRRLTIAGIKDSLAHCHQVLAYGYEVDNANKLTLLVYDNN